MEELDSRLQQAVETRNQIAAEVQRVVGRLDAAKTTLSEVEKAIRAKGLDPDALDKVLEDLEGRYADGVASFEQDIEEARTALTPYLENP